MLKTTNRLALVSFALTLFGTGCNDQYGFESSNVALRDVLPSSNPSNPPSDPSPSPSPSPYRTQADVIPVRDRVQQKIDMLFVVDDSGSMAGEQSILAESFSSFIAAFDAKPNIDWQIGVTTTTIDEPVNKTFPLKSGKLRPLSLNWSDTTSSRILKKKSDGTHIQGFKNLIKVGAGGSSTSGYEQGLRATELALGSSLLASGAENAGFLRDDSYISVIIATDEDEHIWKAPDQPLDRIDRLISRMRALRPNNRYGFKVITSCNMSPPAVSPVYPVTSGENYYPAAYLLFTGITGSNCIDIKTNFGTALADAGQDVIDEVENEFRLTYVPAEVTMIEVRLNGRLLSLTTEYIYHADRNTIELIGAAKDEAPGKSLRIEYPVAI